jgi:oligopeptide transport system permease protein
LLHYFLKRLGGAIPTLFIIITVSFFLVHAAPGGPFDTERHLTKEIEANLNRAYHLDESVPQQFLRYLAGLAHGDFGPSFQSKDYTVAELIAGGFPTSLMLGSLAMLVALACGLSSGIVAALRQNTGVDYAVMGLSMTGIAVPTFVVAPILSLVLGLWLRLVPVGGWEHWSNIVLPVIALALPQVAAIARLTRGSMLEVLRSNYVRTARAKGLPNRVAILRHAIRAAIIPVVSYLGPAVANIITGSVVIEQIYSIPGIGRYFVQAALNRDYPLVMGVTIFYGLIIIFCNLMTDIVYGFLDPKVRYD